MRFSQIAKDKAVYLVNLLNQNEKWAKLLDFGETEGEFDGEMRLNLTK
jgi:hypothetical protein